MSVTQGTLPSSRHPSVPSLSFLYESPSPYMYDPDPQSRCGTGGDPTVTTRTTVSEPLSLTVSSGVRVRYRRPSTPPSCLRPGVAEGPTVSQDQSSLHVCGECRRKGGRGWSRTFSTSTSRTTSSPLIRVRGPGWFQDR